MRKIWRNKEKRRSFNGLHFSGSVDEEFAENATLATVSESNISGLIRTDYDTKVLKNSWANVIINTKDNDINDLALKLFRIELKGSHLYLYPGTGYKSFRIGDRKDSDQVSITSISQASIGPSTSVTPSMGPSINMSAISGPTLVPPPTINAETTTPVALTPSTSIVGANTNVAGTSTSVIGTSTLLSPIIKTESPLDPTVNSLAFTPVHPELKFNYETNQFLPGNPIDALVHFFLFDYEHNANIDQLITLLPILPDLPITFKLIDLYLHNLSNFEDAKLDIINTRIMQLLTNIHDNFKGFCLKSDVAPHILQVMETLTSISDSKDTLQLFKDNMLENQRQLLDLTNEKVDVDPLLDLGANYFLNHVNVIEFAASINAIDLKYFNHWNSNIDKSLLLHSTVLGNSDFYKKNPLFFNNEFHIHYLGRLFINQMFNETTINSLNCPTSLLEFKARLIEKWIDLGCLLDKSGNMSSWLGIASIILSQPIMRLTRIWPFVSPDYIKLLKNDWSPILFELDRRFLTNGLPSVEEEHSFHIMAPRGMGKIYSKDKVIPYFGDLIVNNHTHNLNELEATYKRIIYSFKRWNEYLQGLLDYNEIIKYNSDVLKRYDSMGFIFSNESLNQVLYLGDSKPLQPLDLTANPDAKFCPHLLKLIDINTNSINLEKILTLSLCFEPELLEAYHKPGLVYNTERAFSNLSVNSIDSGSSAVDVSTNLPVFNNNYFKIDLQAYDDSSAAKSEDADKNDITVDENLVFRIDDFVDLDKSVLGHALDDVEEDDEDDVPGLGINVDDILNSDKFNVSPEKKSPTQPLHSRASVISSGSTQLQIYKYIPKYANANRLVDLLLIDSKYLDETINIDLTEYRFVFLLNYSSFITTRQLLEALAHRFINSGNAVISIMKKLHAKEESEFPNWDLDTTIKFEELGEVDYLILLKIQINILKALVILVNNFYNHISMDLTNKKILIKLLKLYSNEILQWYNSNKLDNLENLFESLVNYYKKLKKLFLRKTYRPLEVLKFDEFLIHEFKFNNSLHEVPINRNLPGHKNINKIEKFLHKFNKLLMVFYKGIRTEDWFNVYKILEFEYENGTLTNFSSQKPVNDDTLIVSNIFTYFDNVSDQDALVLNKFPLVFRKLFKLYGKFQTYIMIQLTDLNIGVEERLDRMKTLLYMVKICQLKFEKYQFVFQGSSGIIPSCIESAITNVIYSPESRCFANLWIRAATSLDADCVNYDDLNSLLPQNLTQSDLILNEPLLPCFGWVIENLLYINKCPTFNNNLINFNKRYLVYKLIKELTIEDYDSEDLAHNDTREFEFLLKLDNKLINYYDIREFTSSDRSKIKIFSKVLKTQNRLLSVEHRKQQKENKEVSHITKKPSNPNIKRQSFSYKTNFNSRFKISGFFNKRSSEVVSSKDLPTPESDTKVKPMLVIPLKNMKIFPVYLLPLCFKIDNDHGGDDYLFQALNDTDLNDWLVKLNYANRHWFYSRILNNRVSFSLTFGIPIEVVCTREGSVVPKFLTDIFNEIETEGIKDVGVYRISTSISELANLKSTIDKYGTIDHSRGYDTHALTSCVKSYFRELPDALLPDQVIEECLNLRQQLDNDSTIPVAPEFKRIFKVLPQVNFETLKTLIAHLLKVCEFSDINKMTPANIATVIGPALTEASNLEILVNNFGFMNFILEKLIVNSEDVFTDL